MWRSWWTSSTEANAISYPRRFPVLQQSTCYQLPPKVPCFAAKQMLSVTPKGSLFCNKANAISYPQRFPVLFLFPVPGGNDGPSGVLICSENYITYKNLGDQPDIRCPIPRRRVSVRGHKVWLSVSASTCCAPHLLHIWGGEKGMFMVLSKNQRGEESRNSEKSKNQMGEGSQDSEKRLVLNKDLRHSVLLACWMISGSLFQSFGAAFLKYQSPYHSLFLLQPEMGSWLKKTTKSTLWSECKLKAVLMCTMLALLYCHHLEFYSCHF